MEAILVECQCRDIELSEVGHEERIQTVIDDLERHAVEYGFEVVN